MTASLAPSTRLGGVDVRACSRHLAIVVSVRGDLAARDVPAVSAQVCRFILSDTSFVLDLGELSSFGPAGAELLCAVDEACAAADVEWALVARPDVAVSFDTALRDRLLPLVASVADALHDFADARSAQRTALLPLLRHSA
jgi:anti-anti-sigma regulatory factor